MTDKASIDRIYILDGGLARVEDGSIFWPGIDVGKPATLSCNAYLIHHRGEWLIWDTGTPGDVIADWGGRVIAHGIRGFVVRTLESQLEEIGVRPHEVAKLIVSHAHYDHIGNVRLFRNATWIIQKTERDAMFSDDPGQFGYLRELYISLLNNETQVVEGDHDVFGDGAVRMIFTPGHTLGHCSLLVRLPKTGPVLLSGDVAHNSANFTNRRVPSFNADREATLASMDKVDQLLGTQGGTIWLNHDTVQSGTLPHAPAYIL